MSPLLWKCLKCVSIYEHSVDEEICLEVDFLGKFTQLSVFMVNFLYFLVTYIALLKMSEEEMFAEWGQVEE